MPLQTKVYMNDHGCPIPGHEYVDNWRRGEERKPAKFIEIPQKGPRTPNKRVVFHCKEKGIDVLLLCLGVMTAESSKTAKPRTIRFNIITN